MYDLNTPEEELKNKVAVEFFGDFDTTARFNNVDFVIAPKITHPLTPSARDREDSAKTSAREGEAKESPRATEGKFLPKQYFLWAEAKRGKSDIIESFIQLILTIGKAKLQDSLIPPYFLGAFDAEKFAFVEFSEITHIFSQNDFNWNITPSNYESKEFKQLYKLLAEILEQKNICFDFARDNADLREFIKANFTQEFLGTNKIQVKEHNLKYIYIKWLNAVKPSISIDWDAVKPAIMDADFFLADLLSRNNSTSEIIDNLRILLENDIYKVRLDKIQINAQIIDTWTHFSFKDAQKAHTAFWNTYERPPKKEFWNKFINRRDLLVPQDIRERKGAFFTPSVWVQKAQEYLEYCLGESWQDEYYIWDCCAGTGNLLAGLKNPRNIYASTIDSADVDIIKELSHTNEKSIALNLLENHIFQFDFLNDEFFDKVDSKSGKILVKSKLPESLQEILRDESKRQKLVIFINPPYAEAGSARQVTGTGANKIAVATDSKVYEKYSKDMDLGLAIRELFAQFFMRIYKEIPNCILGSFSTLKYVNASGFIDFRNIFKATFLKGFIIPAWTFDNVNGDFPIGFLVWDLGKKADIKKIKVNVFNENNRQICKKHFYAPRFAPKANKKITISQWITSFETANDNILAFTGNNGPDIQNNKYLFLSNKQLKLPNGALNNATKYIITKYNLIPMCVYFAVRKVIKRTWINDRDQFLYPKNKWRNDNEFHNDCLTYTLFHGQNRISANLPHPKSLPQGEGLSSLSPSLAEGDKGGGLKSINHFIPFSEVEVGAKEAFKSDFVFRFINGRVKNGTLEDCFIPSEKIAFSLESKAVFESGLKLWRYYHKCAKNSESYLNDASLYDIKEYFQGRSENGKMNAKSADSRYNELITALRIALQTLAQKIEPKIYEYEFLRE